MRTRLRANFPREKPGGRRRGGVVEAVRSCGRCAWSLPGKPPECLGVAAPPMAQLPRSSVAIGQPAHPPLQGSPPQVPCSGERRRRPAPIVLPSPYGPRMQTPRSAPKWRPTGARRTGATAMPRPKSLTRRFLQHLLLISLARTILTAFGRGRAWDDWDERKLELQPTEPRKHKRRFVQALSFCAIFFAGLALSAGAGNGVYSLLEADGTTPAATGATGASGPSGPTGATGKTPESQTAVRTVMAAPQPAPVARPTAAPARVAVKAADAVVSRPLATP